jgi:putative tryptophan/tyrosine transport system substrate-binding protein
MVNPGNSSDAPLLRLLPANAHALGLELLVIEAREASELPVAFDHVTRDRAQALFISSGPLFFSHRKEIVAMAARERLPAIYGWREFPEAGGLVSYGPSLPDLYRQPATMVDKILKGASPADLPFERATRFELAINLKTAKALGLTIPESFLLRADGLLRSPHTCLADARTDGKVREPGARLALRWSCRAPWSSMKRGHSNFIPCGR